MLYISQVFTLFCPSHIYYKQLIIKKKLNLKRSKMYIDDRTKQERRIQSIIKKHAIEGKPRKLVKMSVEQQNTCTWTTIT